MNLKQLYIETGFLPEEVKKVPTFDINNCRVEVLSWVKQKGHQAVFDKLISIYKGQLSLSIAQALPIKCGEQSLGTVLLCSYLIQKINTSPVTAQTLPMISYIGFLLDLIYHKNSVDLELHIAKLFNIANREHWFEHHGALDCKGFNQSDLLGSFASNTVVRLPELIKVVKDNPIKRINGQLLQSTLSKLLVSFKDLSALCKKLSDQHRLYLIEKFIPNVFAALMILQNKDLNFCLKFAQLFYQLPVVIHGHAKTYIKWLHTKISSNLDETGLNRLLASLKLYHHIENNSRVTLFSSEERSKILEKLLSCMTKKHIPELLDLQQGFFRLLPEPAATRLRKFLFDNSTMEPVRFSWESKSLTLLKPHLGTLESDPTVTTGLVPYFDEARNKSLSQAILDLNKSGKMPIGLDELRLGIAILCADFNNAINTSTATTYSFREISLILFLQEALYQANESNSALEYRRRYVLGEINRMGFSRNIKWMHTTACLMMA